jgi:hypothetical protein
VKQQHVCMCVLAWCADARCVCVCGLPGRPAFVPYAAGGASSASFSAADHAAAAAPAAAAAAECGSAAAGARQAKACC